MNRITQNMLMMERTKIIRRRWLVNNIINKYLNPKTYKGFCEELILTEWPVSLTLHSFFIFVWRDIVTNIAVFCFPWFYWLRWWIMNFSTKISHLINVSRQLEFVLISGRRYCSEISEGSMSGSGLCSRGDEASQTGCKYDTVYLDYYLQAIMQISMQR